MKAIFLMSLYQSQPCLNVKPYMRIHQVKNQESRRLTMTKGNVNFTDYWFATIDASKNLEGKYSGQHFSLLTDDEQWKWGKESYENFEEAVEGKRFIGVALIKIRAAIGMPLEDAQKMIEKEMEVQGICGKIYRTFDNADFILLILDGKRKKIKEQLSALKRIKTDYQHENVMIYYSFYSLAGTVGKDNKRTQDKGADREFIIQNIEHLDKYLFTRQNNKQKMLCGDIMKNLWEKIESCGWKRNVKWISYYQALHQIVNLLSQYDEGNKYKDLYHIFFPALQLFIEQLDAGMKKLDEGFTDLDKAAQNSAKYTLMQNLEDAVSEFIDSMEVLFYHIGVSCANILDVEGRNGLPYDVSIRLCMMYISSLHMIAEVLNDTNYRYEFCLVPRTHSRPQTSIFNFGLEPGNRLIRVQISKQQMLSPRALIAILAHEASHYIGNFRKREVRADSYTSVAAILLLEELLPSAWLDGLAEKHKLNDKEQKIFDDDCCKRKNKLLFYLKNRLGGELKKKNTERKQAYHLEDMAQNVNESIEALFYRKYQEELLYYMDIVTDDMKDILSWQDGSGAVFSAYEEEVNKFKDGLADISVLNRVLNKLLQIQENFKEIVADLGAILILELTPDYYLETFLISESYIPDDTIINEELLNRIAVVKEVMCDKDEAWRAEWQALQSEQFKAVQFPWRLKESTDRYIADLKDAKTFTGKNKSIGQKENPAADKEKESPFHMKDIVDLESDYLKVCCDELKEQINHFKHCQEEESPLALLRNIYKYFHVYELWHDLEFDKFFADLKKLTDYYKKYVGKINREINENNS